MRLSLLAFLGVLFLAYACAAEDGDLHSGQSTTPAGHLDAVPHEDVTETENQGARVVRRAQGGGFGGGGGHGQGH